MNEESYSSNGPVRTMPGSASSVEPGTMCDQHPDRPAVFRIQGETDSFGCEYFFVCQECKDEVDDARDAARQEERYCGGCNSMKKDVHPVRDYDEGTSGPLYYRCPACCVKMMDDFCGDQDDYDDYDDYD